MRKQSLTPAFSFVQGSFWMSFCVSVGFAAVHLQALGFSNTELGLVMAAGNVLGTVAGPLLAALAEKHRRLNAAQLNLPLFALRLLCIGALLLVPGHDARTAVVYAAYIALTLPVNSLNLKLCVDAEQRGIALDYGVARGVGSLCFVLLSMLLGGLVERFGVAVLLYAGVAVLLLQAVANAMAAQRLRLGGQQAASAAAEPASSLLRFLAAQPHFAAFLAGSVLLYFAHNAGTNFMINLTQNVGGDTETMGYLNGFMAAVEIPVMLLFSRFLRGRRVSALLGLSVAAFLAKQLAIAFAPNVALLFAAHSLQAPSFALYTCAVVPYVAAVIPARDAAKAQSLAFSMTTLGAVLASLIAGRLYDTTGVQTTMLIAAAACAAGVAICLFGIQKTAPAPKAERS